MRVRTASPVWKIIACLMTAIAAGIGGAAARADQDIYTDTFQNGWQYWGWAKTVHVDSTNPVHSGKTAIAVIADKFEALNLHHPAFDTTPYAGVSFWIDGGASGGQQLKVQANLSDKPQAEHDLDPLKPGWQHLVVALSDLGAAKKPDMTSFWIQDMSGTGASFSVDDVSLVTTLPVKAADAASGPEPAPFAVPLPPMTPRNAPVTVLVDAAADRHAISPLIYGSNFAGPQHLAMGSTLNRFGGNSETRYNWQADAHNIEHDYYYESVPVGDGTPGGFADAFVAGSKAIGAQPMITIPMIGWVAKLGPGRQKLAGYSIAKYGPQKDDDKQWFPDAGNGARPDGTLIEGNDPNDADVPANPATMQAWVRHLIGKFGTADNGGVRYYIMDNEPNLWHLQHHDVHPHGATLEEVRDKIIAYASMVKATDPSAQVVAPEAWDWLGTQYSGADIQQASLPGHSWDVMPDRHAHGDEDFVPWILDQLRAYETETGHRLIDVCSIHYYPQDECNDNVDPVTQLRRNRSTRSLWDPDYMAESWVKHKITILPRLKAWVQGHYPGLKTALTEYNWGADNFIGGATAQADVLGILGREGIDMATRFEAPNPKTPVFNAFRMYRNYDGHDSAFGETSIRAAAPDPDDLAAFAAVRSGDHALTVMVINKVLSGATPLTLSLSHAAPHGPVQAWQLTAANTIDRLPDTASKGGTVTALVPPQSITLYVIPTE